jgi:thiamine-phosphate pyrophosphorylase
VIEPPKIQYIINYPWNEEYLYAIKAGINFIQFRIKQRSVKSDEALCLAIEKCKEQRGDITLIIDDYVDLVREMDVCGVHLGKMDMPILEARKILPNKIIGATANCFKDILNAEEKGANYIGLGPYKYTTTKKNLSPILGISGIESIINECQKRGINIPIYAIGGIVLEDIPLLKKIGVYGIALSGVITYAENPFLMSRNIVDAINKE